MYLIYLCCTYECKKKIFLLFTVTISFEFNKVGQKEILLFAHNADKLYVTNREMVIDGIKQKFLKIFSYKEHWLVMIY